MMVMWGQEREDSGLGLEKLGMDKVFPESASVRVFSREWIFFLKLG